MVESKKEPSRTAATVLTIDGGVVDENVEAAVALRHLFHHAQAILGMRYVALSEGVALSGQLFQEFLCSLPVLAIGYDDLIATLSELSASHSKYRSQGRF